MRLRNLFLPTPVELGFSNNFALQSELLDSEDTDTWENYYRKAKKLHPYKYFLFQTVKSIVHLFTKWPRIADVWYYIRTHTYNRYHILDLRKAEHENPNGYRWGYSDPLYLLLLANFKILRDFVEQVEPASLEKDINRVISEGDPNKELAILQHQQKSYVECMLLYRWWTVDRFAEYKTFKENRDIAYKTFKSNETDENRRNWFLAEEAQWQREQEMLVRLINIRGYLS